MAVKETKQEVFLKSQDELGNWLENYLRNEKSAVGGYLLNFDKNIFKIQIKITGDKYNSTITPPIMEHLLEIQKGIYTLYR